MGGRIEHDAQDDPRAMATLGDSLAEAAWPGVFSGGKQIVATAVSELPHTRARVLSVRFSDGSEMNISGIFEIRYKQPSEQDRIEQGKQLMSGHHDDPARDKAHARYEEESIGEAQDELLNQYPDAQPPSRS